MQVILKMRSTEPRKQAQSDDATFAVAGAFVLGYQPRICARQSATAADTNPFLSSARLLPTLVLCAAAYQNQMMHIKVGVPRRRPTMCVDRPLHVGSASDMCIRLRSFPHLSSAFCSLRRLPNENRARQMTRLL